MLFAIYERVRAAASTRALSGRSAGLFPPEIAAPISVQAPWRVVRCCQLSDGYPEEGAHCRVRYHFQKRAAVVGGARFSLVASQTRINRGARSKDRPFSSLLQSERALKRPLPRRHG